MIDPNKAQFRINEQIKNYTIRLTGDDFYAISEVAGRPIDQGIYDTSAALKWAYDLGMDLIEISGKADPPVCKISDFNKFLYNKKKK